MASLDLAAADPVDGEIHAGPGAVRAAAVVLALGPEFARGVLTHLDQHELRVLARGARLLRDEKPVAMTTSLHAFVDHMGGFGTDVVASDGLLRDLVSKALGIDAAERAFAAELPPAVDTLLAPLLRIEPADIALLLSKEKPQVAALVLGAVPSDFAARIFDGLSTELRGPIVEQVARLEVVSLEVLEDLVRGLLDELSDMGTDRGRRQIDGFSSAIELIRRMDEEQQQDALREIAENSPELADRFKSRIFVFDDIAKLMDKDVQLILKEIDIKTLTIALKSASNEVKEKIMRNMSSRVAQMLLDDIATLGPVRLADVETARTSISQNVLQLAQDGRIALVRGNERML
jgi:flagellar motor switch protein FliG